MAFTPASAMAPWKGHAHSCQAQAQGTGSLVLGKSSETELNEETGYAGAGVAGHVN